MTEILVFSVGYLWAGLTLVLILLELNKMAGGKHPFGVIVLILFIWPIILPVIVVADTIKTTR